MTGIAIGTSYKGIDEWPYVHSMAPMGDMPDDSAGASVSVLVHEVLVTFAVPLACGWSVLLLLRGRDACSPRLRTERFAGALSLALMATAAVLM